MSFIRKYSLIAIAIVFFILLFAYYSDERNAGYQFTGIIHDVKSSTNGYIFFIDTADQTIRCFSSEQPNELGLYSIRGNFSDDRGIFFIERWLDIDNYQNND